MPAWSAYLQVKTNSGPFIIAESKLNISKRFSGVSVSAVWFLLGVGFLSGHFFFLEKRASGF